MLVNFSFYICVALIARVFPRNTLFYNKPYEFTSDWFSTRVMHWRKLLKELSGKEGLKALEVGSYEGRSAIWLLENILTSSSASLTCIDFIFGEGNKRFLKNISLSGFQDKVHFHNSVSEKALPLLHPLSFDLIYIDGGHTAGEVFQDAQMSWRALKPGGIMIFDDYLWIGDVEPNKHPKLGIDKFLENEANEYAFLHKGYQIIIKKNADLN